MAAIKPNYYLFILFCLLVTLNLYAQSGNNNGKKIIELGSVNSSLDAVVVRIREQTGIAFSYNTQKLKANSKITFVKKSLSINEILQVMEAQLHVTYTMMENHVILQEKKGKLLPKGNGFKDQMLEQKNFYQEKANDSAATSGNTLQEVQNKATPEKVADTVWQVTNKEKMMESSGQLATEKTVESDTVKIVSTQSKQPETVKDTLEIKIENRKAKNRALSPIVRYTLTTDEVFYVGAQLSIGIPYLHGVVSSNTNFDVSEFRYGVGTLTQINKKWTIGATASIGTVKKYFNLSDTASNNRLGVKSKLNKLLVYVEWKIDKNISVGAGLSYNMLFNKFYLNGLSTNSDSIGRMALTDYTSIEPARVLPDIFTERTTAEQKSWVGFQLSVSYYLNQRRKTR